MYHKTIAVKDKSFNNARMGMQMTKNMILILLLFHFRFLNLSENIGISEIRSPEKMQAVIAKRIT